MAPANPAKVFLVGAGPGDPGLLTRRGAQVLASADVVVYDHLSSERLLHLAPQASLRIFAGKTRGKCPVPQDEINRLLVHHASAGRRVVRLKGGDPYIFGRGAEEAEHLRLANIPFEIVPGVTAATGATAYAGIPLTHRDDNSAVALVTGHADPHDPRSLIDWNALARFPGTLVFYMGYRHHAAICQRLLEAGLPASTPAALIQSGTLPHQKVAQGTLADLPLHVAQRRLGPPALLVIGQVVHRRAQLSWFEKLPLFGRRILVTRPEDDAEHSAAELEVLGAEVLVAPTIRVQPLEDPSLLDAAILRLPQFDWLVFTSANGVRFFLDRLLKLGYDLRLLGTLKLAAIGPTTAEALHAYHLNADLVPKTYRSEALADSLASAARGARILLARADRGREILKQSLDQIASVEQVAVYRNLDADALPLPISSRIDDGSIDWITLTSSAITQRLHALLSTTGRERIARGDIRLASISPVTSQTASELGWTVHAEAQEFTWNGLLEALVHAETSPPR